MIPSWTLFTMIFSVGSIYGGLAFMIFLALRKRNVDPSADQD